MGIKEWLIPQDGIFFDLLDKVADDQVAAADYLKVTVATPERIFEHALRIKEIENHCDSVVHSIITHLNTSFITPIEHDDISLLARKLDDIVDNINAAIDKMHLYEATNFPPDLDSLIDVLHRSCIEIKCAVNLLRGMKHNARIEQHCVEINRLENVADEISRQMIAKLYKSGDVMQILKYKDIIVRLETATDSCEDVANVLSNIVVKNA